MYNFQVCCFHRPIQLCVDRSIGWVQMIFGAVARVDLQVRQHDTLKSQKPGQVRFI